MIVAFAATRAFGSPTQTTECNVKFNVEKPKTGGGTDSPELKYVDWQRALTEIQEMHMRTIV